MGNRTVGTFYWERAYGRYKLYEVVTKTGAVRQHSDLMTFAQAKMYYQGVRCALYMGTRKAKKVPALRRPKKR